MSEHDMIIGLVMIVLASTAAYYFYLARLYNARESNYKDQAEDALEKYSKLEDAAQSVIRASISPDEHIVLLNEINLMGVVLRAETK